MAVTSTVLFGRPHQAIASLISSRIAACSLTKIVAGFATPGGLSAIDAPIRVNPGKLRTLIIGAATYPAFQALDDLLATGVSSSSLWVHLGHSSPMSGRRNPYARYHPMLHSKIYYMELPGKAACAFVGSHNLTSFALGGLNGEAAVMLEGPVDADPFHEVRQHIDTVQRDALPYTPALKEGYAWWSKQYFEGLDAEVNLPRDWTTVRTILIFATRTEPTLWRADEAPLRVGDKIYFEMPEGIRIEALKTEVHLFIFDSLPKSPFDALMQLSSARERFTGVTVGADDEQGNAEVRVNWRIEQAPHPILRRVPSGLHRPSTPLKMQQVRAKVEQTTVAPFEYAFEREREGWEPVLAPDRRLRLDSGMNAAVAQYEGRGADRTANDWRLVTGLEPRKGAAVESDQAALVLARPDSGSFALVALRRRKKAKPLEQERLLE